VVNARLAPLVEGLTQLASAGIPALGHVSLGYATRPAAEVRAEIAGWALLPVVGVFLDHAPAGPFHLGPVVRAVRLSRQAGLGVVVVNPGVAVDREYRRIEATICTFDGSWLDYLNLPADRTEPGDGHLVYGAPDLAMVRDLATARGAGLLLATARASSALGPPSRGTPWSESTGSRLIRGHRRGRRSVSGQLSRLRA
jgi:hypothetical protein